jgi:hypothetical protein
MFLDDLFIIEFSTFKSSSSTLSIADGCSTNGNYYMSGGSRKTCCCDCDKATEPQ